MSPGPATDLTRLQLSPAPVAPLRASVASIVFAFFALLLGN
ncbi:MULTISPECIES: hypothetical protein [unclassified Paraburkholderia]|nr:MULTISPECIES: hypothetical protein [unclassified Paraburkholderia]